VLTLVLYALLAVALIAGLFFLAARLLPPGGQIAPPVRDEPLWTLPAERRLDADDVAEVRIPVGLRGYRFAETDLLLDRLGDELRQRDEEIARLRAAAGPLAAPVSSATHVIAPHQADVVAPVLGDLGSDFDLNPPALDLSEATAVFEPALAVLGPAESAFAAESPLPAESVLVAEPMLSAAPPATDASRPPRREREPAVAPEWWRAAVSTPHAPAVTDMDGLFAIEPHSDVDAEDGLLIDDLPGVESEPLITAAVRRWWSSRRSRRAAAAADEGAVADDATQPIEIVPGVAEPPGEPPAESAEVVEAPAEVPTEVPTEVPAATEPEEQTDVAEPPVRGRHHRRRHEDAPSPVLTAEAPSWWAQQTGEIPRIVGEPPAPPLPPRPAPRESDAEAVAAPVFTGWSPPPSEAAQRDDDDR
jgi:hypothetical protein